MRNWKTPQPTVTSNSEWRDGGGARATPQPIGILPRQNESDIEQWLDADREVPQHFERLGRETPQPRFELGSKASEALILSIELPGQMDNFSAETGI